MSRRQEGTGKWFLESEKFQAWMRKKKETLFCPGIPGAGKTIMTAIVISHLYQEFAGSNTGIAYIYFNFQRQAEQSVESLLASLLKQLARSPYPLPESVSKLYDQFKEDRIRPSFAELSKALRAVAALYSRVFIIIDALDECDSSGNNRTRFLRELFDFQAHSGANICATSRNVGEVSTMFASSDLIPISATVEDVEVYLNAQMAYLDAEIFDDQFLITIRPRVLKAVDGMYVLHFSLYLEAVLIILRFLLAKLHIDLLAAQNTKGDVLEALHSLGKGEGELHKTYEQAVERINSQRAPSRDLAWRILEWIVFSKRPLSTAELQHALAVRNSTKNLDENFIPSSRVLQSVCAGLVTIDKESGIVRLDHYTIQEFFIERDNELLSNAVSHITEDCVRYLSFDTFKSGLCESERKLRERLETNALYDYASKNWGYHAFECSTPYQSLISLLKCEKKTNATSQVLFYGNHKLFEDIYLIWTPRITSKMTGLHLAAFFGLHDAAAVLLNFIHPNLKDEYGRGPLFWAARNGHDMVIKLLLAQSGVRADARDDFGQAPLHIAAHNGHTNAVKMMLTPTGGDPNLKDWSGRTLLMLAAKRGHEGTVRLLLSNDKVAVDMKDENGCNSLLHAVKEGNEAVVRLLLNSDKVDVNMKDRDGCTPLLCAIMEGHQAVVQLLLSNNKVDIIFEDMDGFPLLWKAEERENEPQIEFFLENDPVDAPNLRDRNGFSPLLFAASTGNRRLAELLLTKDSNIEIKSTLGRTPLSLAVEGSLWNSDQHDKSDYDGLVSLLLEVGADFNTKDMANQTPLTWAAINGQTKFIKMLFDSGSIFLTNNIPGQTPLERNFNAEQKFDVRLLLRNGIGDNDKMKVNTSHDRIITISENFEAIDTLQKWMMERLSDTVIETLIQHAACIDHLNDAIRKRLHPVVREKYLVLNALLRWAFKKGPASLTREILDGHEFHSESEVLYWKKHEGSLVVQTLLL